jgi:hypothetical protein
MTMTDEQYTATAHQLFLMAQIIRETDVNGFLERIAAAESMAPILDPTLARTAGPKLEIVKAVAFGALQFQKALPTLEETLAAEAETAAWWKLEGGRR